MEFAFDDDIFETKSKPANQLRPVEKYIPKNEYSGYFLTDHAKLEDALECLRMKANYFFLQRNYSEALDCYKQCHQMAVSDGAKFEFLESQVHCYLKLNQFENTIEAATDLFTSALNFDQQVQAFYALQDVYYKSNLSNDCVIVLSVLLTYFDTNPQLWLLFGCCISDWNGPPMHLPKSDTVDFKLLCPDCLQVCHFAALVRCNELIKLLQIGGERKQLTICASKCAQLLTFFGCNMDYDLFRREMCKDLDSHKSDSVDGEVSEKPCMQKFDEHLFEIHKKFLIKWFSFVIMKCITCREF